MVGFYEVLFWDDLTSEWIVNQDTVRQRNSVAVKVRMRGIPRDKKADQAKVPGPR
jgi:hypothetical protein